MTFDPKDDLRWYLQRARAAMVWKLDGLCEYDARRPLVPAGTNLPGLIKHLTGVEFVYFGTTFGRPSADEAPWSADDPMTDMFASGSESREQIAGRYKKAWAHSDATLRHAGHADIVRELIDGSAGLTPQSLNLPDGESRWERMSGMTADPKDDLRRYLQQAREAMVWKAEGLSEYDARRPLVPTGTNLLGMIKHLAGTELLYFGFTFGRPSPYALPFDDDDPLADLFVTAGESRAEVIDGYRRVWAFADTTIEQLPLDAAGKVPHWDPEHAEVTLHQILVHVIAETHRHAGHADIVRELIDGSAGRFAGNSNLPGEDEVSWPDHWQRVEQAARDAG